MDGGAWWAAVHGVVKSQIRLRDFTFTFHFHALEKESLLALWYECIFQLSVGLCTLLSVIFVHILLSMFPFYTFFRLSACPISSTVQLHFGLFPVVFISFTVLLTHHYIFLVLKSNVFIYLFCPTADHIFVFPVPLKLKDFNQCRSVFLSISVGNRNQEKSTATTDSKIRFRKFLRN